MLGVGPSRVIQKTHLVVDSQAVDQEADLRAPRL